jgi:hypothetical protein
MIEAIVSPEWEERYYSFDAHWADGEEMASMRNGSGDAYSIVFSSAGAFVRGLDHESDMSPAHTGFLWPGLVDAAPAVFAAQIREPAFSYAGVLDATFCLWRQRDDEAWKAGTIEFPTFSAPRTDPDGSSLMTILCTPGPASYLAFAADYYGVDIDPDAARQIWLLRPLDDGMVAAVNIDLTLADVRGDADEIGYPTARP